MGSLRNQLCRFCQGLLISNENAVDNKNAIVNENVIDNENAVDNENGLDYERYTDNGNSLIDECSADGYEEQAI